ncbi:MAG: hypothetical protein ABI895_04270 [Deltaproteobacteria bacterium]
MPLLGYRLFDEYKVMGLAPYGRPEPYAALAAKTAERSLCLAGGDLLLVD